MKAADGGKYDVTCEGRIKLAGTLNMRSHVICFNDIYARETLQSVEAEGTTFHWEETKKHKQKALYIAYIQDETASIALVRSLHTSLFLAVSVSSLVFGQTSNLPDLPEGVFSAQASVIIEAPLEKVWEAILDFPSYPKWNPFAWSMTVANSWWIPSDDQTPQEDRRVIIRAQIPPLPLPVDENTLDNPLHTQLSFENITTIDTVNRRTAWRAIMLPQVLLDAERWQAVSTTADGKTFYESKEIFYAPVSYIVDALFSKGIQQGFDWQAAALKSWVEGGNAN